WSRRGSWTSGRRPERRPPEVRVRKRLIAGLGAGALLAALLAIRLLGGGGAPTDAAAPLARRGDERTALPTYAAEPAAPTRAPDGVPAAESQASAPLLPDRASLTVTLPAGVSAAGDVFLKLSRLDGSLHSGRLLSGSATWDDLLPGDYE